MNAWQILRQIVPAPAVRVGQKRVGVWVKQDRERLTMDEPADHEPQLLVGLGERQIRRYLRRRIAQPECVNVARDDERIGLAVAFPRSYGRVERIRVTILKQPGEFVVFDPRLNFNDLLFDRLAHILTLRGRRPIADKTVNSPK